MKYKETAGSRVAYTGIILFLSIMGAIALYPFIFTFSNSISDPMAVMLNQVRLWPVGFSLSSYKLLVNDSRLWQAYYNTIWYTLVGTGLNLVTTIMGGYALSRKNFIIAPVIMVMVTIPMFFNGGMVPSFVVVNALGLYNTRWAIVLPAAVSSWNLIITRTFFRSTIPDSIPEAAKIDGANDIQTFIRVVVPVSKAIIAIIALYAAVSFWNVYFNVILYTYDNKYHPMTVLLRVIIISTQTDWGETGLEAVLTSIQMKYTAIVVAILPIVCIYPFLQRYFVKGVLIGSIKE